MENYFVQRKICPGCNSINNKTIYSLPYSDTLLIDYLIAFYSEQGCIELNYLQNATYTLEECQDCSMIFQGVIPNNILMHKLYEEWLDPVKIFNLYEKNYSLNYYFDYASQIYWIISQFKCNPNKLSFLDFGMGWGNWSLIAKSFGCNSYGSELSEVRIKHASANGINIISWNEISNNQFDFINADQVFEHIPDPLETLRYLSRSLKPNGFIRISVPDGNNAKEKIKIMDWKLPKEDKNSVNIVAPLEHINCFNYNSIIKMAELSGLEPVLLPLKPRLLIDNESSIKDDIKDLKRKSVSIVKKVIKRIMCKHIPRETYNCRSTNLYFHKIQSKQP